MQINSELSFLPSDSLTKQKEKRPLLNADEIQYLSVSLSINYIDREQKKTKVSLYFYE